MTLYNKRLAKAGTWWEKVLGWEEYNKFVDYEPELASRANTCIFCSRLDLACVRGLASNVKCELVPNGVDCERYFFKGPEEEEPGTVVFTGSFRYRPNCLAAEYFLETIFPTIEKSVPSVRFLAVGNGAVHALRRYKTRTRVQAVDFVPDLRPYLAKATVAVAPLTVGAGVSNKLGEGFAVGTAVVATPLACGDLRVTSGDELFIAEGPKEFASHVITLLNETTMRRQMAIRARRFVESTYSWEIVSSTMEDIMRSTAGLDGRRKSDKAFARA
jgi:glycosyltransferase involved in cell wall biosynthesis